MEDQDQERMRTLEDGLATMALWFEANEIDIAGWAEQQNALPFEERCEDLDRVAGLREGWSWRELWALSYSFHDAKLVVRVLFARRIENVFVSVKVV